MYNLENYETVKERKKKFYEKYPNGRIIVVVVNKETIMEYVHCFATVYKTAEEQEKNLPLATGNAHEIREKELKISKNGHEYESINYTSWVENCEESAVGRALDNAGFSGNNKCSRDEIEKVKKIMDKFDNNLNDNQIKNKKRLDFAQFRKEIEEMEYKNAMLYFTDLLSNYEWSPAQLEWLEKFKKEYMENHVEF